MSGFLPSISVVIPAYNRAHLLERAIDSALLQLENNGDEIIVVDDGSTDDTLAILGKYGEQIRIIRSENRGAGAARNLGIKAATNDLVAFLDSDDEWMPDKLAAQRTLMANREDILFAFGNMACTRADGTVIRRYLWNWHKDSRPWSAIVANNEPFSAIGSLPEGWQDFQVYTGDLYADLAHRLYVLTSSCIVRRQKAGSALAFDEDIPLYEDWGCFARLANAGKAAYMDTELTWQHGHTGKRLTGANDVVRSDCRLTILGRIWGTDDEYQASNGDDLRKLVDQQRLKKTTALIKQGEQRKAREVLSDISDSPLSLKTIACLPGFAVRLLLDLRRVVKVTMRRMQSVRP